MISIIIISKDEASLDDTLTDVANQTRSLAERCEVLVIDASNGRLDGIRRCHESQVRWLDFEQPPGIRVSIPHQRNVGVREADGDIIVFTDAGCRPHPGWLSNLVTPLFEGEDVVAGAHRDGSGSKRYERRNDVGNGRQEQAVYLSESPTLNFAFNRQVFDKIGGFDENLAYGSDVDFCWRLTDTGFQIRFVPDAIVEADWGTPRRQRRRSYVYGKARARLYRKHRSRLKGVLRNDPMVIVDPLFIIALPITLIFPLYPFFLVIPAWLNRDRGVIGAFRAAVDHLWYGAGVIAELATERTYAYKSGPVSASKPRGGWADR